MTLRTPPAKSRPAHELPGWYPAFVGLAPDSAWTSGDDRAAFGKVRAGLRAPGPTVLRDYAKSMKHYRDTVICLPNLATPPLHGRWPAGSGRCARTSPPEVRAAPVQAAHQRRGAHLVDRRRVCPAHPAPGHVAVTATGAR